MMELIQSIEKHGKKVGITFLVLIAVAAATAWAGGYATRELVAQLVKGAQAETEEKLRADHAAEMNNIRTTIDLRKESRDKEMESVRRETAQAVKNLAEKVGDLAGEVSDLRRAVIDRLPAKPLKKAEL